ncbi:MAG: DNA polymerase III subunit delta [Candidatus Andersenbacteria bacterium]
MIILLSSQSYRLLQEQLAQLVGSFKQKAGAGASLEEIIATSSMTAKEIWSRLGTGSLFASKRLVLVRDALDSLRSTESKSLAELLKKRELPAGTTLVLLAHEPLPPMTKNPLYAFCKKTKAVRKISVAIPEGPSMVKALGARAQKLGVNLPAAAARELLDRAADFDQALNELDKLALYALSQKNKTITLGDIQAMTTTTLEADIFAMLRALSAGQRAQALRLLHRELAAGAHPLYILAMLRYQFRSLILVAESDDGMQAPRVMQQRTGLSPFVIRSMQQTLRAGRYSTGSIKAIFNKLVDADEAIKTSAIDGDVALDLLVLAMSR